MNSRRHREREIAEVLIRRGMDYLVGVFGLERWVSMERALLGRDWPEDFPTRPQDLRLAFEELGPTFVKVGQVLSTRADVLPLEYQAELAKLQDAGPWVRGEIVQQMLEEELQEGVDVAFASFEAQPIAAASIGQVHAAALHDGTQVVVKVRRPGVVEVVEQDLAIMKNLAARASRRWGATPAARSDLVGQLRASGPCGRARAADRAGGAGGQPDREERSCRRGPQRPRGGGRRHRRSSPQPAQAEGQPTPPHLKRDSCGLVDVLRTPGST